MQVRLYELLNKAFLLRTETKIPLQVEWLFNHCGILVTVVLSIGLTICLFVCLCVCVWSQQPATTGQCSVCVSE